MGADLWPLAQAKGVSRKTFDEAVKGLHYDPKIAAHTEAQAEFSVPIWTYLAGAVIPARVVAGRKQYAAARDILARAKTTYGVDAGAIMGAWGVETEFGAFFGGENVLNALATLGYIHYQGDLGRDELLAAMRISRTATCRPARMRGSWAGAMGQPQFMPSSYLEYAVDFDGDGKRDIWRSKADSLGSIAHFLAEKGWTPDLPWAVEVDAAGQLQIRRRAISTGPPSSPNSPRRACAPPTPARCPRRARRGCSCRPGRTGPILLATHNFDVIKTYNNSNAYVLAVGLLGDAIVGRRAVAHALADERSCADAGRVEGRADAVEIARLRHRRDRRPRRPEARTGDPRLPVRARSDARRLRQPGAAAAR